MLKKYKAIFFDWDGTAVMSRRAPVDQAVAAMRPLLQKGIKLIIVSGTTIENIAGGKIESYFAEEELKNLYLGLGRGAYNYSFKDGIPYIFKNMVPDKGEILKIHQICFEIHQTLKEKYDFDTDIVFSRPNYCKIDLMVENQRGDNLFMQEDELGCLRETLKEHGMEDGLMFYRKITAQAGDFLETDGYLCYEIGAEQAADVSDIMKQAGFKDITVVKDLAGFDRVVMGRK